MTNPVGRPSQLAETMERAKKYLYDEEWKDHGVIPSVAGLACYLGKSRKNIYVYGEQDESFKHILDAIVVLQEHLLLNNGLNGTFNSNITKLVLGKHGYHEKTEIDNTSSDGTMTPHAPTYKVVSE